MRTVRNQEGERTHNLFDDFGRGVEVNKAFVHLEFKLVPGLRTFTARLMESVS